eukprot:g965.t1
MTEFPKFRTLITFLFFLNTFHFANAVGSTEPTRNQDTLFHERRLVVLNGTQHYETVLSLDGGGLRGIITTEILMVLQDTIKRQFVQKQIPVRTEKGAETMKSVNEFDIDLADFFKTIAGVSAGSWIATYLASKGGNGACDAVFQEKAIRGEYGDIRCGSIAGLRVFFLRYGNLIYRPMRFPFTITPRFFQLPKIQVPAVLEPAFKPLGLDGVLKRFLGDTLLVNTQTSLFVHAYDLIRRATVLFISDHHNSPPESQLYVFHNDVTPREASLKTWQPRVKKVVNKQFRLRDLARASSAAPSIHPAKFFTAVNDESLEFYCVDGALMANNPTLMTIVFLTKNIGVSQMDKLAVLSIGMGVPAGDMKSHAKEGIVQWMLSSAFLSIVMDGGSELIQTQVDGFFAFLKVWQKQELHHYLRIQTTYDTATPEGQALAEMTDFRNLFMLQKIGKETATIFKTAILNFVDDFLFKTEEPLSTASSTPSPKSAEAPGSG